MKNIPRVLIVEDEFFIARSLFEELQELNTKPLGPVQRGETAVKVALKERPDLILMDIRLAGGMDGIEAAHKIQEKQFIPIVFMSACTTQYIIDKAKVVNSLGFIEKPVITEQIKKILESIRKL